MKATHESFRDMQKTYSLLDKVNEFPFWQLSILTDFYYEQINNENRSDPNKSFIFVCSLWLRHWSIH